MGIRRSYRFGHEQDGTVKLSRVLMVLLYAFALGTQVGVSRAGLNPHATIPLHCKAPFEIPCTGYLPVDCNQVPPTVVAPPDSLVTVFVFVRNHGQLAGIQTAFEWGSWDLMFNLWDCQPGMLDGAEPQNPGGPQAGILNKAFSCVTGPSLAIIGRMYFNVGAEGCLRQVQPNLPFGIHFLDCQMEMDQVSDSPQDQQRLGKICVGPGGHGACEAVVPVEGATWGRIKASY